MRRSASSARAAVVFVILTAAMAAMMNVSESSSSGSDELHPYVVVLGIAQDGGVPHAGCAKSCCAEAWKNPALRRHVACLAIVDPGTNERWLVDATPDFPAQLHMLDEIAPPKDGTTAPALDGILLTHAHSGHYTGLMHLGREVMNSKRVAVHAMPRMRDFLSRNGPWDQLLRLNNIEIRPLEAGGTVQLNERITITPMLVPHRDEYTETVGFRISGPDRTVLFIPDIDKWEKWDHRIEDVLATVDAAYLDGTFFADGEVPGRSMAEIPHPFITESLKRWQSSDEKERRKVRFIHLNHTNAVLQDGSDASRTVTEAGCAIAREGERQPI